MGLGETLRQQLAAKALKRQLERATDAVDAPGVPDAQAAQSAQTLSARSRFEAMPQYQQVKLMREMGETLRVESPFFRVHDGHCGCDDTNRRSRVCELRELQLSRVSGRSRDCVACEGRHRPVWHVGVGEPHRRGRAARASRTRTRACGVLRNRRLRRVRERTCDQRDGDRRAVRTRRSDRARRARAQQYRAGRAVERCEASELSRTTIGRRSTNC